MYDDDMDTQQPTVPDNNVFARLRILENTVQNMHRDFDRRLIEARATWEHGNVQLMEGIKLTHKRLWEGSSSEPALAYEIMILKRSQEQRSKVLWWFLGFVSSGALLTLGAMVGRLLH